MRSNHRGDGGIATPQKNRREGEPSGGDLIGAGDEGFEAYTQHHFKTVSSNINILAGLAYWSTIKTLPATLPEPRTKDRGTSFGHQGPRFGCHGAGFLVRHFL